MSGALTLAIEKNPLAVRSELQPHAAVKPVAGQSLHAPASSFSHDLSQFPTSAESRSLSCGAFPRTCPFGGACHTCPSHVQRKPAISEPGDEYEREADRVAERVMRMPAPEEDEDKPCSRPGCAGTVQRQAAGNSPASPLPQQGGVTTVPEARQSGREGRSAAGGIPAVVAGALRSPGRPLDAATRAYMEPRFGRELGDVRVHTDEVAAQSARSIRAQAYTLGRDVVFAGERYAPGTRDGQRLIAHELAHVMQQGSSPATIRRQEEDAPSRRGGGGKQSGIPVPDVVIDPTALSEPGCPAAPTRIGNLAPTPMCDEDGEEIDGTVLSFCVDSDVFKERADLNVLRNMVNSQPSGTTFHLRAHSSVEGPGTGENARLYNRNLSCHRLNRVVRELLNLGVQESQIDAVSLGPTERFGAGPANRPFNRVVVINADPTQHAPRPSAEGMTMEQIRDAAKQRIASGDYPLAADGYFARWSCGRWRTLSEAVNRTNVLIEGTETNVRAAEELGTIALTGENTIVISPLIAKTTDPIGCAANRIVDLTMHHFSRPALPVFDDQHKAGLHLVSLCGLPECRIPLDPFNAKFEVRSQPDPVDPFTGFLPSCADRPLAGPLGKKRGPATLETPPTFTAAPIKPATTSGQMGPALSGDSQRIVAEGDAPIALDATVTASGDPKMIGAFEIGFVQTVEAESLSTTYVDGRRERRRLPLPLRDGPPSGHSTSDPPWFTKETKVKAVPGVNTVHLEDRPAVSAFKFLPDLATSEFVERSTVRDPSGVPIAAVDRPTFKRGLGQSGPTGTAAEKKAELIRQRTVQNNVPDKSQRTVRFNTWVVARRSNPRAGATLEETDFLAGIKLTDRITIDWSNTRFTVLGRGSFDATSTVASPSDAGNVMLRGATPADFFVPAPLYAEFLDIDPALPRAQAGGLDRGAYFAEIRRIALPHRTSPGLRSEINVRMTIEAETGRLVLDTPELDRGVIKVLGPGGSEIKTPEALRFARDIFPEVRKLVAARNLSSEPQTGLMTITVRLDRIAGP